MFWFVCAALLLAVAVPVLMPFLRPADMAEPAAAYDLRVYRDQLREVDRDLERGVISADEAERLRTEIGRKVLDADKRLAAARGAQGRGGAVGAIVVLALVLAAGVALYLREGAPGAPDQPLAERFAEAQMLYDNRPSQSEAEADAPPRAAPAEPDAEYLALIEQLREAVARNPEDPEGLSLLVTHEMRIGNLPAARSAQERLIAVQGDRPDPDDLVRLASLMIDAAGGIVTPEAEAIIARALQIQPGNPQARYLMGLLQIQIGRPDRAFLLWRALLEEGPEAAPWIPPIRASITDLAWLAGVPDYQPPAMNAGLPGPDAAAIAAAEDLSDEERAQMIEGMVAQLESRLAQQGGAPQEWARLISSLAMIGQPDRAALIWAEAQQVFATSPEALAEIGAAARNAGVAE